MDLLSPLDQALRRQVLALSRQRVSDAVKLTAAEYKLPGALVQESLRSREAEDAAARNAPSNSIEGQEGHRLLLGLVALATHEKDLLLGHFAERTVSGRIIEEALTAVGRLIDRTRAGGEREYIAAAQHMVDFSGAFRVAHFLHRRFSWDGPLMDRLADRFELLLNSRIVLQELEPYVTGKPSNGAK